MIDLYGTAFREVLHPAWERLRGRPTLEHLALLEESQWWSPEELRAFQDGELRKLLEHAHAHVPFYRRVFSEANLVPSDIAGAADLSRLPVLDRERARASLAERQSRSGPSFEIRKMTSGTTGEPLVFGYDRGSDYWRNAVRMRGYGWAGYRLGDRSVHYWGSIAAFQRAPLYTRAKVRLDHALKREHFIDCTDRSERALAAVVDEIRRRKPDALLFYAQAGVALARHVLETGSELPRDMALISAAERLYPADRELLTRALGPNVFETYGSREVMLMAAECEAHSGMHVCMENLIVEILVREGDGFRSARSGEMGQVVVTDLHNHGCPFIRYVTGDLATALEPGRCACGRGLDRISAVEGRSTDTLRDASGRPVSGLFFNVMFSTMADEIRNFQVVQHRDGSIDLNLVPARGFEQDVVRRVSEHCRTHLGVVPRTHLVSEIPLDGGGKLRVVRVESN